MPNTALLFTVELVGIKPEAKTPEAAKPPETKVPEK